MDLKELVLDETTNTSDIETMDVMNLGKVLNQKITENYCLYNGDAKMVLGNIPDGKVGFSIYSPPFAKKSGGALYSYSSSEYDLSNCKSYEQFFDQYEYIVREIHRVTMPGRLSAVHCMDVPNSNSGGDYLTDFPGDIIRLHEKCGWKFKARHGIWKEPLGVRNRTMAKDLAHKTIVEDSANVGVASMDQLLVFVRDGKNKVPIAHPQGLLEYAGSQEIPKDILRYKGYKGNQIENRYSHWIWRQYASSFWIDVRLERVLPYVEARDEEDEKHVHPLQLDVYERAIILRSNPGEIVLEPFMGVGSGPYSAVRLGRKAIGIELKKSYFSQAVKNIESIKTKPQNENGDLFADLTDEDIEEIHAQL